jgi:predicted nucleotidyltransferase
MTPLSTAQLEALRRLRIACPEARIALIGATALAFHLPITWRRTADIDLILAVSASELDNRVSLLPGWQQDPKHQQRWNAPNHVRVDLIPAPPDALNRRRLVWPNTKEVMNLGGIRLALESPVCQIASGLTIAIASVPVIAILNMTAYLDRPAARTKDLQDLAYILSEYPTNEDDRLYGDDIFSNQLDDRQARAFILGREIRALVDEDDCEIVRRFLQTISGGDASSTFAANSPWHRHDDREQQVALRLDALHRGFGP